MMTCADCGIEKDLAFELGIDMKDHWYRLKGIMLCKKCFEKQNEDDFEKSLKESDWGHQPS